MIPGRRSASRMLQTDDPAQGSPHFPTSELCLSPRASHDITKLEVRPPKFLRGIWRSYTFRKRSLNGRTRAVVAMLHLALQTASRLMYLSFYQHSVSAVGCTEQVIVRWLRCENRKAPSARPLHTTRLTRGDGAALGRLCSTFSTLNSVEFGS